jgi:anti-anti-sigma factor
MPDVRYPITLVKGVPVITAPLEIDISTAGSVRAAIAGAAACGHATFVVDMALTQFCDSAGLHVMVRAHKRALAEGGELRLVISTPTVRHVFAVTGVDRVIPNFPSLDEALAQTPAVTIQATWPTVPGTRSAADLQTGWDVRAAAPARRCCEACEEAQLRH